MSSLSVAKEGEKNQICIVIYVSTTIFYDKPTITFASPTSAALLKLLSKSDWNPHWLRVVSIPETETQLINVLHSGC